MAPPWAETPTKVVIEYIRSGGVGSRKIMLRHKDDVLPTQLHGRVHHQVWADLIHDCMELAKTHPYTQRPGGRRWAEWLGAACCSVFVGFCLCNPDGGEYEQWVPQVSAMLERHRPFFSQAGCNLSVQHVHGSFWVQIDVDPKAMAIGQPVPAYPAAPAPGEEAAYPQQGPPVQAPMTYPPQGQAIPPAQ